MAKKPRKDPQDLDLDLEPHLRVQRLNRLAVLLAAAAGIIVLWVGYFVLSQRKPIAQQRARVPQRVTSPERLALERLQFEALKRPEPDRPFSRPEAGPPSETRPRRPVRPNASASATKQRLRRALDSDVLVLGFGAGPHASLDSPAALPEPIRLAELQAPEEPTARSVRVPPTARLDEPTSPYVIQEGSLIPAILSGGIHSDLPGQATALVRRNVYDSLTGRHLLIPQGARLLGSYDHRIAWGQKRILLAWNRLILPDGRSLELGDMPGADLAAMAGLRDEVHNHFVRTFGGALLLSAVSAGSQLSQPQESSGGSAPSARQIAAAALGQELGRATAEITRRNVDLEPTLEIRPGYLFHVEVTADLHLPGPYSKAPKP